jgi:hypothetical protein
MTLEAPALANLCFLAALVCSLLFARRVRERRPRGGAPRRALPARELALIVAAFVLFAAGIALSL